MKTKNLLFAAGSLLLLGCTNVGNFTNKGIPKEKYYVGGGFSYFYKSQVPGNLYIVEKNSEKILSMHTLDANRGTHDPSLSDPKKLKDKYGIEKSEAAIAIYFIPEKETKEN